MTEQILLFAKEGALPTEASLMREAERLGHEMLVVRELDELFAKVGDASPPSTIALRARSRRSSTR